MQAHNFHGFLSKYFQDRWKFTIKVLVDKLARSGKGRISNSLDLVVSKRLPSFGTAVQSDLAVSLTPLTHDTAVFWRHET
jgi:hypothetical protein